MWWSTHITKEIVCTDDGNREAYPREERIILPSCSLILLLFVIDTIREIPPLRLLRRRLIPEVRHSYRGHRTPPRLHLVSFDRSTIRLLLLAAKENFVN